MIQNLITAKEIKDMAAIDIGVAIVLTCFYSHEIERSVRQVK